MPGFIIATEEDQKLFRLMKAKWPSMHDPDDFSEEDREDFKRVLDAARAIFREERAAQGNNPRSRLVDNELSALRAEIALRASVVQATRPVWAETANGDRYVETGDIEEHDRSAEVLRNLLARERELMTKSEPEGGDRG